MGRKAVKAGVVDFGSREIRVLIASQSTDGVITINGHGTAPSHGCVSQGVIQDRNAAQAAFKRALDMAEKEARCHVGSLFCGINGRNVDTLIREGRVKILRETVELEQMAEARDIASRDVLAPGKTLTSSITAQEWYVDDLRVMNPLGIRGEILKTRIHFARIPEAIEENIAICIESQKRELEDMIFTPLASALGCLTPEDMELGVAVIDMGRSTTGLAVYRDFRIMGTASFEWGGYHLTRDVAAGLQISFREADELILEYGISDHFIRSEFKADTEQPAGFIKEDTPRIKLKTAVPGAPTIVERSDLDMIIYERAKELMIKVRQHLHARGLSKNLVRGVVLTGGASVIKNYVVLAEAVFQAPSRVGFPNTIEIMPKAVQTPEFSAAVGIVRHAFYYRSAARNGHMEPQGRAVSMLNRIGRFIKRNFL